MTNNAYLSLRNYIYDAQGTYRDVHHLGSLTKNTAPRIFSTFSALRESDVAFYSGKYQRKYLISLLPSLIVERAEEPCGIENSSLKFNKIFCIYNQLITIGLLSSSSRDDTSKILIIGLISGVNEENQLV